MWPWTRVNNVDYKERWLEAVALLGDEGRLTPEEVRRISGEQTLTERVETAKISNEMKTSLRSMASWDRADLEIQRAKEHKPPLDDLVGMSSWDKADVLKARVKYGTIS